ncbi:hypothetical protein HG449_002175 [Candidatus Saccharibacteria bacterium]|nr:hypothetical protein [Candidatus Saccharibacteria bacterium]
MIKSIANNFLKKKSAPIICFFGSMLVFAVILLGYSSSYAVAGVSYGTTKTNNFAASSLRYIRLTYPESTTFNIDGTNLNTTMKANANIQVATNSQSGFKLYISSSETSLKTSDGAAEIPYENLTTNLLQQSSVSANKWAIFIQKTGIEYIIPLCANDILTDNCKISESSTYTSLATPIIQYGTHINMSAKPGTYSSKPLVLTAVINSGPTAELKINSVSPSVVPLDPTGHTVKNEAGQSLKHKMNIKIPMIERDFNVENYDYKKFKATAGGLDCPIDPTTFSKTTDEISFDCTVDFNNANPLFQAGQKTEVVVETIPYGYTFSKQNAIEFVNSWVDYGYTGAPQEFTFPVTGKYKLEVMGASGGPRTPVQRAFNWYYNKDFNPGLGGYSSGYKDFNAGDRVALFVGGRGEASLDGGVNPNIIHKGGFNGGGNGTVGPLVWGNANPNWRSWGGAGGGGGTDIRPVNNVDYATDPTYHIELRPAGSTEELLNKGPWAPLDHGVYQAVFEVENIPDSDFEGALAYYDLNSSIDKQFRNVYTQKHGNFISVYFAYDVNQPAPQFMPNTAAEIRIKVKTTNTTARIKSLKFYKLTDRIIVGGGGAGGTLIAGGGHGGGLTSGAPDYSGVTTDPMYGGSVLPVGANQTSGASYGFGASAPRFDDTMRSPANPQNFQIQGRPGAGGGWTGGFVAQTPYDLSTLASGASGGSGYIGGVTSGFTRKFDDDTNISPYWQPNFVYDGHDGSIRISYATYPGGTP